VRTVSITLTQNLIPQVDEEYIMSEINLEEIQAVKVVDARGSACPGQFHCVTGAIEQLYTEGLLKRLDVMADRRLRYMQSLCSFRET
jgi:hypothetical protein